MERPGKNRDVSMTSHVRIFHEGKNGGFLGSVGPRDHLELKIGLLFKISKFDSLCGYFYWTNFNETRALIITEDSNLHKYPLDIPNHIDICKNPWSVCIFHSCKVIHSNGSTL